MHTWYNYTVRVDMGAIGWSGAPATMRDAIVRALNAEGAQVGCWQSHILPAMTVFRAQNAYGHGCPWRCPHTEKVEYDPAAYPVAQRHCDTHFGMTTPLRCPNGPNVALAVAEAFHKVFAQLDRIPLEAKEAQG